MFFSIPKVQDNELENICQANELRFNFEKILGDPIKRMLKRGEKNYECKLQFEM